MRLPCASSRTDLISCLQVNVPIEAQLVTPHQQPHLMHPGGYPAAAEHAPSATESAAPQILGELQQLQLKQREQLEKVRRSLVDIPSN